MVKDRPILIQVTVPRTDGKAPVNEIEVVVSGPQLTFIGREYEGTDTVTLIWTGNVNGPAIYRSAPLTIEKGGEGVEDLGVPGFEFNVGGMSRFSVDDGDVITVGLDGAQVGTGGAGAGIQVFSSTTKLQIAMTLEAIGTSVEMYTNVIINANSLEDQIKTAPDSDNKKLVLQNKTGAKTQERP